MTFTDAPPRLRSARVHEASGPGAHLFAAAAAARSGGTVLWIEPARRPERLMPAALARFLSPAGLMVGRGETEADLLWMAEEGLRSAAFGLVVAEPQKPLSLTAGRRLQLAAEAGRTTGILLIREGAGSNAAETRWHCAPLFDARDSTLHRWSLIKNKTGTTGNWTVQWDETARSVRVVSAAGERFRPADKAS